MESATGTVTRTSGTTDAVTVDIGTLPSRPSNHHGYILVKSSELPVTVIDAGVTPTITANNAPVFTDGSRATRSIAENTAAGVNIGTPVDATDDDNDTLTYALSGTDAESFTIDSTSGQLKTSAKLNYEVKAFHSLVVLVTDGQGGTITINVTINVTDIDETDPFVPMEDRTTEVVKSHTCCDTRHRQC